MKPFIPSTCRKPSIPLTCLVVLFMLSLMCCNKADNEAANKSSIFDVLGTEKVIDLELTTFLDSLIMNKEQEQYQAATLTYSDSNGLKIKESILISARGKTRKNYCSLPPIKLKFPESNLEAAGLAGFKTLKLVMPCKNDSIFEDFVVREHLCYQLYQLITDNCFRVQMARLKINCLQNKSVPICKLAFLIEHKEELAQRLHGTLLDESTSKIKSIDKESYNRLVLFQYMIGNTDWNLSRRHNIKLIDGGEGTSPVPVPYDFDYSGLVNTNYAIPHPNLPVKNVRDRFFQWRGKNRVALANSIELYKDKKDAVFQLIEDCHLLSQTSREDISNYVRSFYEVIEQDDPVSILTKKRNN